MSEPLYDLDIRHYSIEELIELFDLTIPLTTEMIKQKLTSMLLQYKDNDTYHDFIQKVYTKFMDYMEETDELEPESDDDYNMGLLHPLSKNELYNANSNMMILHKSHESDLTQPSDIVAGNLNPIKRRILKKILLIDTKFRHTYTQAPGSLNLVDSTGTPICVEPIPTNNTTLSTDFTFQLPNIVKNIASMKLTALEIPNSIYVFDSSATCVTYGLGTNVFIIDTTNIVIPEGNYTHTELQLLLNTILPAGITIDAPTADNKFRISNTSGADITIDFRVPWNVNRNIMLNAGWILGFRTSTYTVVDGSTLSSEGLYDATGSKYLYLLVNDFNSNVHNNFVGVFDRSLTNPNILTRIPQSMHSSGMIYQYTTDVVLKQRNYFGPVNIERLHIQLIDEHGRIVNLNNMDFSFTLELGCVNMM